MTPLQRACVRVAVLSAFAMSAWAAPALADDPPDFCVSNPTSSCPGTVATGNRAASFSALQTELSDHGQAFDTVIVEPDTYSEAVDFTGPANLTVYGDPSGASVPVITSAGGTATVTDEGNAGGLTLSHLDIVHTGAAGPAFKGVKAFTLSGVSLDSSGPAIDGTADLGGSETLTNVTATSTAPDASPLVTLDTISTVTLSSVDIEAQNRASGLVIRNGRGTANNVVSYAHAAGGAAILFTGEAGASDPPNLVLSHAIAQGGSFGVASLGANMQIDNSLATSDGTAPDPVTVGAYTKSPAFGPAAIASGAAATVDLGNVTAYAVGSTSDGIVANSARGKGADNDPFAYRAFIRSSNSIFHGGRLDVEATPEIGFDDPNDIAYRARIGTAYDNFATFDGPKEAILGDTTDQIDDPMFVNPSGGDFHVKNGSRTLGAGSAVTGTDLDGNARPNPAGSHADLGAYESNGTAAGPGTPPPAFTPPTETASPAPTATATPIGSPAPPSNKFSVSSASVKKGVITYKLSALSAGTFTAKATTKIKVKVRKHHKTKTKTKKVTFATATAHGTSATLVLKPSKTAAKGLKHHKKEKVTVTLTFLPDGGKAATSTQTVTVKK